MKIRKSVIIPINLLIVAGILVFVVVYAARERRENADAQIQTFENLTLAMERVTGNFLEQEQKICDAWANFLGSEDLSMEQAAARLRSLRTQEGVMIHLLYADEEDCSGLSTVASGRDGTYSISYAGLALFKPWAEIGQPGASVNLTRTYTNPINGAQSIAFYNRLPLTEGGRQRNALILRVVPTSALSTKWIFPTEEYKQAEISLIDGDGNYIIKGRSFKNTSFFEFYKSYNETDYQRMEALRKDFLTGEGTFLMRNSRDEECLIAHCRVNSMEDWAIVSYIRMSDLGSAGIDWPLILVVAAALVLLLAFDLVSLLSFSRAMQNAALAAEDANMAKSEFLSNMSHEIRTPITGILGMNEMIQRESMDRDVLEYSDNIQKAGVSLLGIINDILDFSKIEAGKMDLIPVDYSFPDLVSDVANLMWLRAEAKGLEFEVSVDPRLPKGLHGDEIRIKQIITNLLSNAVKYTEKGGVRLQFSMLQQGKSNVQLQVSVDDTGIGIRQEDMGKLFAAFERLDVIRTRKIMGTGLGLPITRKMLSMMGSELEVQSVYGIGSKFYFALRQDVTDWTPVGQFDPLKKARGELVRNRSRKSFVAPEARILIVDDTPMNLQVISGLLKRTLMQVDTVTSGADCLKRAETKDYDLIFLDYRMPEMDGIETLHRFKELFPEKAAATPVISLTASAVSGSREIMLGAGFTDYLSKPVDIHEMEDMLMAYLPSEKVHPAEKTEAVQRAAPEGLPAELLSIPQLDVRQGLRFCGDAEDYLAALKVYFDSISARAEELRRLMKQADWEKYTILVHSLKSTSRSVGAVGLSDLARALEQAGNGRDTETLYRDTPRLLDEYLSLKGLLEAVFRKKDSESNALPLIPDEELNEAVTSLKELASAYDYASICMVMEMLEQYQLPDEKRAFYEKLRIAVDGCDWEKINAALTEAEK